MPVSFRIICIDHFPNAGLLLEEKWRLQPERQHKKYSYNHATFAPPTTPPGTHRYDGQQMSIWGFCISVALPPISMTHTEKIFSASVLADTLPKPTLVRLLRVK